MAIGIDDLYDEEELDEVQEQQTIEPQVQEPEMNTPSVDNTMSTNDDFMTDFLRSKGIDDPNRIRFEEEDGTIVERSWNSLTKEEQMNIANTPTRQYEQGTYESDIDDEEINLLNQIRKSGMTPSQYIASLQQGNDNNYTPSYKVEELSDDELFLLDLESRIGELTDEEGAQALASAKQNEELYKKQVEGIRKEYREREDYENEQQQAQLEEEQRQAFEQYQAQIVNAIDNFVSIGDLDLNFEDSDKEELAEFMLTQDQNGLNYFYQALQDPVNLVKAAWFILNGDDAFNSISDYFKDQIKQVSRNQYNKGVYDGRNGNTKASVVIDNQKLKPQRYYKSIEDLDDED